MTELRLQVLAAFLAVSVTACGWIGDGPSDSPPTATVTITQSEPQQSNPSDEPSGHDQGGYTFEMPNEVGNNLQAAQDAVQAASGNPLYFSSSEDATGQSRFQILDADWQVCSQDPAPGSIVQQGADVTFFVVRLTENCP
jgi:predicted small lipoprotein YifL